MAGRNTTQFFFLPESRPDNRRYLLALTSFFWTFCLGCTILSILVDILFSGSLLAVLASPLVILAALLPNIALALLIPRLQRYQRSHRYVLGGAFLAGAIIAIPPALILNTTLFLPIELSKSSLAQIVGYGTIPGIVEEGIKGAILLFIFLRHRDEFHDVVDGIVLGALIGLGFAMTEDITYFVRGLSDSGVVGLIVTLFLRLGLGWMNHSVFTAIFGAALGLARMGPRGHRRWLIPLVGYILSAGLHNTFDLLATLLQFLMPENLIGLLVTVVPLYGMTWTALALLGLVILRGWHHLADLTRNELRDEVGPELVTPAEHAVLPNPGERRQMLREREATAGRTARSLLGKIFQLQLSLGLQKRHTKFGDTPGLPELHSEDALRARIIALRGLLNNMPSPATAGRGGLVPPPFPVPPAPGNSLPQQVASHSDPLRQETASSAGNLYRLIILSGAEAGTSVILRPGLTIGRSGGSAEFTLSDPEVSSLHARIILNDGIPHLVDAGSRNGTYLNGHRITDQPLRPGDRILVGATVLSVDLLPTTPATPAPGTQPPG